MKLLATLIKFKRKISKNNKHGKGEGRGQSYLYKFLLLGQRIQNTGRVYVFPLPLLVFILIPGNLF
jgi:hypothetical protein